MRRVAESVTDLIDEMKAAWGYDVHDDPMAHLREECPYSADPPPLGVRLFGGDAHGERNGTG